MPNIFIFRTSSPQKKGPFELDWLYLKDGEIEEAKITFESVHISGINDTTIESPILRFVYYRSNWVGIMNWNFAGTFEVRTASFAGTPPTEVTPVDISNPNLSGIYWQGAGPVLFRDSKLYFISDISSETEAPFIGAGLWNEENGSSLSFADQIKVAETQIEWVWK